MKTSISKLSYVFPTADEQELLVGLIEIAESNNKGAEVSSLLDTFFKAKTLNFINNETLDSIKLTFWQKEDLMNVLAQHGLPDYEEGKYNVNALVIAMNYEYYSHKEFVDSIGNKILTAYKLAKEALRVPGYIDQVIEIYGNKTI
jgi:hypothetical protein